MRPEESFNCRDRRRMDFRNASFQICKTVNNKQRGLGLQLLNERELCFLPSLFVYLVFLYSFIYIWLNVFF